MSSACSSSFARTPSIVRLLVVSRVSLFLTGVLEEFRCHCLWEFFA
jgi:hypothetical protein